jgi:transposase
MATRRSKARLEQGLRDCERERLRAENVRLQAELEDASRRFKLLEILYAQAEDDVARLRSENAALRAQLVAFREVPAVPDATAKIAALQGDLKQALQRIEELQRANARQAAPFRRRPNSGPKKKPGRKPGHPGTCRRPPQNIHFEFEVPLHDCPICHGHIQDPKPLIQIIQELPPVEPVNTRLITWSGMCESCGEVYSTHPLQVSRAQGAAGVHLGPRAAALATMLKIDLGLTSRKVCRLLKQAYGLSLTPGGLAQLLHRMADRAAGDYEELLEKIRSADVAYGDETSWYVGHPGDWLWVFATPDHTYYHVDSSRGRRVAEKILNLQPEVEPADHDPVDVDPVDAEDSHSNTPTDQSKPESTRFDGVLVTDCSAIYKGLPVRQHKCTFHHLQALEKLRCREDAKDLTYLDAWKAFWQEVNEVNKARDELPSEAFAALSTRLQARLEDLLAVETSQEPDRKFRVRMENARPHLLGCLDYDVDATNNLAERRLRYGVIVRKVSCGNRTARGAQTWQCLASLAATHAQQGRDHLEVFANYLRLAPQAPAG